MANAKSDTWESKVIVRDGYIEYPLPEGITRKITSGKWGTKAPSNHGYYVMIKPASRKKR